MIFKFDFKHQLKLPTLVPSNLHSTGSLSPTVRHEASGFFQIKNTHHIHENKVRCFTLDSNVTTYFKLGLRNISCFKKTTTKNNKTNKQTDKTRHKA